MRVQHVFPGQHSDLYRTLENQRAIRERVEVVTFHVPR